MKITLLAVLSTLGMLAYGGQITLTQNAIVNSGAEAGTGSASGNDVETVPGWTANGNFTVVAYGPSNSEINTSPGASFGSNFFAGGPTNASSFATQTIDVSNVEGLINAGLVNYTLSGYFGGYITQDDGATLYAAFLDSSNATISTVGIGGDNETARNGVTELLYSSAAGQIPVGTTSILITLQMTRTEGSYNDGYADNLSFVAVDPPGNSSVPEPSAWILSCIGLGALLAARRYARRI